MTILSDIIAEINSNLPTNTTNDIRAAAVRTALIDAFTSIVNAQVNSNTIASISNRSALGVHSAQLNMVNKRRGQDEVTPGWSFVSSAYPNNIFPIGDYTDGKYIDTAGNEQTFAGAFISQYFPVIPGTTLTISATGDSSSFAFYDANRTFISTVNGATQTVTVPSNAYFGRHSGQYNSSGIVLPGTHSTLPNPFRTTPATVNMFRPWANKVWSFHGDSQTDHFRAPWADIVASFHGVKDFYNMSQSGAGISQVLLERTLWPGGPFTLKPGYWADKDLVYCAMGSNDAIGRTTMGTIDDATTATTFYGYYKKFIETVLTNNPYCRIVLSTLMYHAGNGTSTTDAGERTVVQSYNTAIRNLAQYYALHLFDVGERGSGFSPATFSALSSDGLHAGYHAGFVGSVTGTSPLQPYEVGVIQCLASNLAAYLLTVFPTDFVGDPLGFYGFHPGESDPNPAA